MAIFPKMKLTEKGNMILNESIAEKKTITFTKIEIGSGFFSGDVNLITELVEKIIAFNVTSTSVQLDKTLRIKGYFDNLTFLKSEIFREIGVFVKISGSEKEYLYSYTNSGDNADKIPSKDEGFFARTLDIINYISNATDITYSIQQNKDKFNFNTIREMEVATFLKKDDKINIYGREKVGDCEPLFCIVSDKNEGSEVFTIANGMFCVVVLNPFEKSTKKEVDEKFKTANDNANTKLPLSGGRVGKIVGYGGIESEGYMAENGKILSSSGGCFRMGTDSLNWRLGVIGANGHVGLWSYASQTAIASQKVLNIDPTGGLTMSGTGTFGGTLTSQGKRVTTINDFSYIQNPAGTWTHKDPSGKITKSFNITLKASQTSRITFAESFPNACTSVLSTGAVGGSAVNGTSITCGCTSYSATGFTAQGMYPHSALTYHIVASGY